LFLSTTVVSLATTFTVTTTADSGPGSLRQAMLDANASLGGTIAFSIGSGLQTIRPLAELPQLGLGTIDGTTQPGYSETPLIEIDGSLLPAVTSCLTVGGAGPAVVKALIINRCSFRGINAYGPATITGNYVGTDSSGTLGRPNGAGIVVSGQSSTIGGYGPGDRNVVSGNGYGIIVQGSGSSVIGNFVGTDVSGTAALPNQDGISVQNTSDTTIAANLLSGNTQSGLQLYYANNTTVVANLIGPSALGFFFWSNQRAGIDAVASTVAQIGGSASGEGNVIAYNSDVGVGVESSAKRIRILGNLITLNGFGIDLDFLFNPGGPRVTANDQGDPDVGGNLLQNFPVLESVYRSGSGPAVKGRLNSSPNEPFRIEFYSNAACNASGHGEGRTDLGFADVVTDAGGDAHFDVLLATAVATNEVVTATATDQFGNTSEFSACEPVGLRFFTVTPCRVADTRDPNGPFGGPALAPYAGRTFTIAGSCGIPPTARSVSVNLTITQPAAPGYLTIYPSDVPPPLASSINFSAGQTRANNAILRLSPEGTTGVYNGSAGDVHFILDVSGFFE
jgi:parallel beta-helix repeat protein